jgi:hypothetical protein
MEVRERFYWYKMDIFPINRGRFHHYKTFIACPSGLDKQQPTLKKQCGDYPRAGGTAGHQLLRELLVLALMRTSSE